MSVIVRKKQSTKSKLMKSTILIVMLLSACLILVAISSLTLFSKRALDVDLENGHISTKAQTSSYFWGIQSRANVIENSKAIQLDYKNDDTYETTKRLVQGFNTAPDLILRTYVRLENGFIYSYPEKNEYDLKNKEIESLYNSIKEVGDRWYGPYIDTKTGKEIITLNKAILDGEKFIGIIGLDIYFSDLATFTDEKLFSETGHTMLISNEGIILNNPKKPELIGEVLNDDKILQVIDDEKILSGTTDIYGGEYIYNVSNVGAAQMKLVTLVSKDEHGGYIAKLKFMIFTILLIILPLVILSINRFSKKLEENINIINKNLGEAKDGDITNELQIKSNDEFESIAKSFNDMISSIRSIIQSGKEVSKSVSQNVKELNQLTSLGKDNSMEVSQAVEKIGNACNSQTEEIDIVIDQITKLAESIETISNKIKNTQDICKTAMNNNDDGSKTIKSLVESTKITKDAVNNISESINQVEDSSKSITAIVNLINGLTDQTNLLALNASIEAARAGEAGRGFSVVAEEIKGLAEESSVATNDINNIIEKIMIDIKESTNAVEDIIKAVDYQNQGVDNTSKSFDLIGRSIEEINTEINGIDNLNKTIISKKDAISISVESLATTIEQTTSLSEEISVITQNQMQSLVETNTLADSLLEKTSELNDSLSKFRVE